LTPVSVAFPHGLGYRIVQDMTCASPPCFSASVPALTHDAKSVEVEIVGDATVALLCRIADGPDPGRGPESIIQTVSGTGPIDFTRWCDALRIEVTSCIACQVSAWVRM